MKKVNLTKEDVLKIVDLRSQKIHCRDIEERLNISKSMISQIDRAYSGIKTSYDVLSEHNKKIIDSLRNKIKPQKYEVKILFGLITLKITPVVG